MKSRHHVDTGVLVESDLCEPLVPKQQCDGNLVQKVKANSMILGLLTGFFVECSALGAHILVIILWGGKAAAWSALQIVAFICVWSFFTSIMPFIVLAFLHSLVSFMFNASGHKCPQSAETFEELSWHLECRFGIGTLIGVCLASAGMDVLLGMDGHMIYSFSVLGVVLIWCFCMAFYFRNKSVKKQDVSGVEMLVV